MTNCRFEILNRFTDGLNSNRKALRKPRNGVGNTNIASGVKKALETRLTLKSEIEPGNVRITLPIKTVSELNCSDHWRTKHKRHQRQQKTVALVLKPIRDKIPFPCHIHLTRLAPRKLDRHDNLPASLKYILDACCAIISGDFRPGRADDDERLEVSYDQIPSSQYGVKVEFKF